jgi:hypothetical protein
MRGSLDVVLTARFAIRYRRRMECELCGDSGTLRDETPCPRCAVSRWQPIGTADEITRPKRTVWITTRGRDLAPLGGLVERDFRENR